jgi:hypothetical protein
LQPSGGVVIIGLPTDAPGKRGVVPLKPKPMPRASQPRLATSTGKQDNRKRVWLTKKKIGNALVEVVVTRQD